jgi:hypothetical protein
MGDADNYTSVITKRRANILVKEFLRPDIEHRAASGQSVSKAGRACRAGASLSQQHRLPENLFWLKFTQRGVRHARRKRRS